MKNSAIYITEHRVRFVENADSPDNQKVSQLSVFGRKKEELPHLIRNHLKERKLRPEHLVLCLPRTDVSLRFLTLPTVNDNEIAQMLRLDMHNLFPCKPEELVRAHAVLHKSAEGYSRVMLAAAPRENLLRQFALLKHAGLIPDAVTLSTVSLFNQSGLAPRDGPAHLVLYFDDGFAEVLCIHRAGLEFSRALPSQSNEALMNALAATMAALSAQSLAPRTIVIAGNIPDREGLIRSLKGSFALEVEEAKDLDVAKKLAPDEQGLKLNLLPEEYRIRQVKERRKRSLIYLGILAVLNLSLVSNILFFKVKAKEEYLCAVLSAIEKIEEKAGAIQKKTIRAAELKSALDSGRFKLGLLSEIYRAAPAGIQLSSLDISGGRGQGGIVLIGQAQDSDAVSKFNNNLKASAFIEKTDLARTTERKTGPKTVVDFEIRASF